jgi:hypothetical protein
MSPRRSGPAGGLGRTAVIAAIVLAVAGCSTSATPSPAPSATSSPLPQASFTGGTGGAGLTLPAKVAWAGGWCERGAGDAWLALNIGSPNGPEYFGLVVGQSPYTPTATRGAAGGGSFGGNDAVITWRHQGTGTSAVPAGLDVEVAPGLSTGSFTGRLADGTQVQGTFSC